MSSLILERSHSFALSSIRNRVSKVKLSVRT